MRKFYEFKCQNCNELHEAFIEANEVKDVEENDKCQCCEGPLKRVWTFGLGQFKGSGFTKRSTN